MAAKKPVKPAVKKTRKKGLQINKLITDASKDAKRSIVKASDAMQSWRWIDFWDIEHDRPCLPLEWFFGTRGMLCGRVIVWKGEEHAGKSAIALLMAAMSQRAKDDAYCILEETESVDAPPHFLASLGVDVENLIRERPQDVIHCMKVIETWLEDIRGSELAPSTPTKGKDGKAEKKPKKAGVDPDKDHPIVLTVDSVSNLGGTGNMKSEHSQAFSSWFRNKLKYLEPCDAVLQITAQLKAFFTIGGFGPGSDKKDTFIAEGAIKFLATWICTVRHSNLFDEKKGGHYGEVVTLIPEKNKLASRKNKTLKIHLLADNVMDGRKTRWCFDAANKILLFDKKHTPLDPDEWLCKGSGGWYGHKWVQDGKNLRYDEFMTAIYSDAKLLDRLRENMKILGFGHKFESTYDPEIAELADLGSSAVAP